MHILSDAARFHPLSDRHFTSTNPATGEAFASYPEMTDWGLECALTDATSAFETWRETDVHLRTKPLYRLARLLRERAPTLAAIAANEMGRPVTPGVAELKKCADTCDWYGDHAHELLAPTNVVADGKECYVRYDPLGPVLAIMPWNFAYWQVLRCAAPIIAGGNVYLLKHAENVQGCANAMVELFREAGFPDGVFQNLAIPVSKVERVLRDQRVKGATLTGGEKAGASVAAICGREIKKTVLELGGNDAFIVLPDADLDTCVAVATAARMQNSGQSCIAAKRFIVCRSVHDAFVAELKTRFENLMYGDPLDPATVYGPMASEAGMRALERQVEETLRYGATLVLGGSRIECIGWYFAPTILTGVHPNAPAFAEETFGPVAAVTVAENEDDAIRLANRSAFGLGASLWTRDIANAKRLAAKLNVGFVGINNMVKSDHRLPFGGVAKSGYGRELGEYGIREFCNIKSVRIV